MSESIKFAVKLILGVVLLGAGSKLVSDSRCHINLNGKG